MQMLEVETTKQQDVIAEIQSPFLDSTVCVKTEMSDLLTEEVIIKPDVDDGHDKEEPQSHLSKMMLDNILQQMYVAKKTPTTASLTETVAPKPTTQLNELDNNDKSDVTAISRPATDIVQWTNSSSAHKSVNNKKKASSLSYRKSSSAHTKFKCSECSNKFQKKKRVQRFTMWELARRSPPPDHAFYPKVVQLVHKHFTDGWKNWVVNDIPYEDIFGKSIDPDLGRKIRFLLPSVELMRAWKPEATTASAVTVRSIRKRLLRWPFGRSLIYAPRYVSTQIHDSSLVFVDEVLSKLNPLILSTKALSAALKEEVLEGKEDVSEMPSTSGLKRVGVSRTDEEDTEFVL